LLHTNVVNAVLEKSAASASPVLELCGITKLFGAFTAVEDLSLQLSPGTICGFLGPNGAGKTTTIRIILEILKPTRGTLTVLGQPSALKVRQRLGYLPEEKGLYKKMKTWAVVAYFATLKGMSRAAARKRAYELLERYGLKDFAEKPTDALSKGMGQKVQLLACLAHDPEFVILDEPFSGLDPVNQQVMEDIIRDMARRNRTVLFSTHVMQHAERLCDRIVLLARGRKIFDGTVAQARRTLPRRVRIETEDSVEPLLKLNEVAAARRLPVPASASPGESSAGNPPGSGNGMACWELELRENADPQAILQACFAQRIRLASFNQTDPSLHDVFVKLVGPGAAEAASR
jgi:ABC-2 type transport system ATP-binding protein